MKKVEIVWTAFSVECLDHIHEYIRTETFSVTIANKQLSKLLTKVDTIVSLPNSGTIEPLLSHTNQNSRYLVEGNYKIIYQFDGEMIIVTDVFHTKQNPKKIAKRNRNTQK
jgi:toxin ParE1/3/4